ncbi:hypothetical protein [Candidatus Oscillochloris fontis]|uniref:hypothetical protein n=1 Tax=Candidatus Oscillochloris fontis TaxID=2496868 RepID=UPI00101B6DDB|nr:hypothetical protein [Candidatus Oscillochloris fontis]
MRKSTWTLWVGLLIATILAGCGGGQANLPNSSQIGAGATTLPIERPENLVGTPERPERSTIPNPPDHPTITIQVPDLSQVTPVIRPEMPNITPPISQPVQATPPIPNNLPAITPQRPPMGSGQISGGMGEGVTFTATEAQLNQALTMSINAASESPIQAISLDLRSNVVGVSATVLVEGQSISTQVGLAPVVEACALSFSVVEEPAQPDAIPAPVWNALVDQIVIAVESAMVIPEKACIQAVSVTEGQISITVGKR